GRDSEAGPHEEHGLDPLQACIQGIWDGQVAAHDVNAARQAGGGGVAGQCTDSGARVEQLGYDVSTDIAGRSSNQNHSLHSITLIRPNASTVGMPVTRHPPCSPGRAVFPQPVPRLSSHPRCKAELSGKHSSTFNLSDAGPRSLDVVEDPGKLLP